MIVVYLVPNQCWCVRHGDQILDLPPDCKRFWSSKKELKKRLDEMGLKVEKQGIVVTKE